MPLFKLKSLDPDCVLENPEADYRMSRRAEQFRFGAEAIYFPAFPGTQYLPYAALSRVRSKNTAISVTGTCGKQLPMVLLRLHYGEEFYKDFMFEKQKSVDQVLEAICACCPETPVERDVTPFGA